MQHNNTDSRRLPKLRVLHGSRRDPVDRRSRCLVNQTIEKWQAHQSLMSFFMRYYKALQALSGLTPFIILENDDCSFLGTAARSRPITRGC